MKIDLWSLGVLVLQCLNGEVPFNGMDLSQYTCDKEIDVGSQIPKGTTLELAGTYSLFSRFPDYDIAG